MCGSIHPWKGRQGDNPGIHWRRWIHASTSPVNIRAVTMTTFAFLWLQRNQAVPDISMSTRVNATKITLLLCRQESMSTKNYLITMQIRVNVNQKLLDHYADNDQCQPKINWSLCRHESTSTRNCLITLQTWVNVNQKLLNHYADTSQCQ